MFPRLIRLGSVSLGLGVALCDALCDAGSVITTHLQKWKQDTHRELLKGVEGRVMVLNEVWVCDFYLPNWRGGDLILCGCKHTDDDSLLVECIWSADSRHNVLLLLRITVHVIKNVKIIKLNKYMHFQFIAGLHYIVEHIWVRHK